jgi:uncharacterized phage protein (TIGR02218 family)
VKTASAGMQTQLTLSGTSLCVCVKIKRRDGEIFAFTEHDQDLTINVDDDGPIIYLANPGFSPTDTAASNEIRADELQMVGILTDDSITEEDLEAGKFDNAEMKAFVINWKAIADGPLKGARYHFGELIIKEGQYVLELRSMVDLYQQQIGELYTPDCRATLGDLRCKVQVAPLTWVGNLEVVPRNIYEGGAP